MNSHLTALVADQQRADLHRAAAAARRTAIAPEPVERPRRFRRPRLRNRPAVA